VPARTRLHVAAGDADEDALDALVGAVVEEQL
jgi:hypothetical protein